MYRCYSPDPLLRPSQFIWWELAHLLRVRTCPPVCNMPCSSIERVLRHRFRYNIEIDEVPTIRVGEFDIEIE